MRLNPYGALHENVNATRAAAVTFRPGVTELTASSRMGREFPARHLACDRARFLLGQGGEHAGTTRARARRRKAGKEFAMLEFAAGIMLGGSIGAVIMGALLGQTRKDSSADLADRLEVRPPSPAVHRDARGWRLTPRPAGAATAESAALALLVGTAAMPPSARIRGH
jgi:hypothetical protein